MSIRFIIGTSGSGKTSYARRRAAELALGGQKAALLVPEQFSFETERAMLQMLPADIADNVEVFSFTRLARSISVTDEDLMESTISENPPASATMRHRAGPSMAMR